MELPPLDHRATIPAVLRAAAERFGARDFVVMPDRRLTFASAEAASRDVAKDLLTRGSGQGHQGRDARHLLHRVGGVLVGGHPDRGGVRAPGVHDETARGPLDHAPRRRGPPGDPAHGARHRPLRVRVHRGPRPRRRRSRSPLPPGDALPPRSRVHRGRRAPVGDAPPVVHRRVVHRSGRRRVPRAGGSRGAAERPDGHRAHVGVHRRAQGSRAHPRWPGPPRGQPPAQREPRTRPRRALLHRTPLLLGRRPELRPPARDARRFRDARDGALRTTRRDRADGTRAGEPLRRLGADARRGEVPPRVRGPRPLARSATSPGCTRWWACRSSTTRWA